ncbi:MAG TPA: helix-turn-helix transcriptional regulator [Acidimicrobiales bacterium]|nr:helix-turn-helix transcriptional regulator [Acidimicrobiales bacterium]
MRHGTDDDLIARGYAVTHPSGTVVLPTAPGWDQLLYASTGVMTVETGGGTWVVPPHRALWAPDGTRYRIVMHGRVAVRTLYLRAELAALPGGPGGPGRLHAVNVPPLLRELVVHAVVTSPLYAGTPEHQRLVGVLVDQLRTLRQAPLQLPRPTDPRARTLADLLAADPAGRLDLTAAAAEAGASRRTLERVFRAETGLSIGRWRQRQRLIHALQLLAQGRSVTHVAHAVGYSTPSAFTVMFHAELGATPSRYFAQP